MLALITLPNNCTEKEVSALDAPRAAPARLLRAAAPLHPLLVETHSTLHQSLGTPTQLWLLLLSLSQSPELPPEWAEASGSHPDRMRTHLLVVYHPRAVLCRVFIQKQNEGNPFTLPCIFIFHYSDP